jgi:hypothetical protein
LEDSFLSTNLKPGQQEFDFCAWATRWGASYKAWVLQKANSNKLWSISLKAGAIRSKLTSVRRLA